LGTTLECRGTPPDFEEHLAHDVISCRRVVNQAHRKPIHANLVSMENNPDCTPVALRYGLQ
jgi:hypothetical protein